MDLPPRLADSTPYLLSRATRDAARLASGVFGHEPLRFPHFVTLCWVEHLGSGTQSDIADATGGDASDLVSVFRDLEAAGLVARTADPEDRRRNRVVMTPAGAEWLEERHARARQYEALLSGPLADGGAVLRRELTALLALQGR